MSKASETGYEWWTIPPALPYVDIDSLKRDLQSSIKGEVRFDNGSRALYATDGSNYRQPPIGVVIPRDIEDVVQTFAICRERGAPILPRGGGTSLAGQCCNVAVIIDFSKYMHHILELDHEQGFARVQPGTVLDDLRNRAEEHHLTFAPDPSTHSHNTLGGMIGNNSCGTHSVMGGETDANIEELEIITFGGLRMRVGKTSEEELESIIRQGGQRGAVYTALKKLRDEYAGLIRQKYPKIPRRVSGYNLVHLLPENGFHVARALVGSEGTCVVVLEAKTRLMHSPPARSLLVLGYPDVYQAADHIMEVLEFTPVGLEGVDEVLIEDMKKKHLHPKGVQILPEGHGWLLAEFGGETRAESDERAGGLMAALRKKPNAPSMKLFDNPKEEKIIWKVRESGLGATARVPGSKDAWEGWEDSSVHPERLGEYLRELRKLLNRYEYSGSLYGHFGQGCVHTRISFDFLTKEGIEKYRSFMYDAADLVVGHGGSLSGEHGDGQSRAELLPKMFGEELVEAFRRFKTIWDPDWKMNPGKLVNPYRMDENLRLGTGYSPPALKTHFKFSEDNGSFPYATLRCVGVGDCRKEEKGTMCPSYMATREEMHSTRGRAHLLFEMAKGELISGWCDKHVKEALDLCLSCKSCKGECPMNVDMAMYKAEFLSHYYKGRIRPLDAYSIGLIYWWSRLASHMPSLANFLLQAPSVSRLIKTIGGMTSRRKFPLYADEPFRRWFHARGPRNQGKPKVLLWADTFNNYFYPEVAQAATEVLEALEYQVIVSRRTLCCGRPLFDYGMLDLAKRLLRQVLEELAPWIADGVPVIGLEPACLSTFRDELVELFPQNENAKRLREQSFLLSEFLAQKTGDAFQPSRLSCKAIVHGHCTHKAVMKMDDEEKVLQKLGLDFQVLDSGCCGVSGAFGFRKNNYELSMQIGERVLLPAVREAPKEGLVIANGFSCREQIAHATDRQALHLAQVILMAVREDNKTHSSYPERKYFLYNRKRDDGTLDYKPFGRRKPGTSRRMRRPVLLTCAIGVGMLCGGLLAWSLTRRRSS
jgi:FAD/FMN-containing dehydrogenase/Fe-S oxidoreductase